MNEIGSPSQVKSATKEESKHLVLNQAIDNLTKVQVQAEKNFGENLRCK